MLSGKKVFVKMLETGLVAVISGFVAITFFGTSNLEYKYGYKDQYFDIPAKAPDELVIQHKGKKIENISVYDFLIYNRYFKEPEDVTIFFEVSEKDGKPLPQVISLGLYPPSNLPEKIGISEVLQHGNGLYSFKLDVVKKTGSDAYYLARFIFEGKEAPEIKVSIPTNAGVNIDEYSNWREYASIISVFIVMTLVVVIPLSLMVGWQNKGAWSSRRRRFIKVLGKTKSKILSKEAIGEITTNYESEFKPEAPYFYSKVSQVLGRLSSNKNVSKDAT